MAEEDEPRTRAKAIQKSKGPGPRRAGRGGRGRPEQGGIAREAPAHMAAAWRAPIGGGHAERTTAGCRQGVARPGSAAWERKAVRTERHGGWERWGSPHAGAWASAGKPAGGAGVERHRAAGRRGGREEGERESRPRGRPGLPNGRRPAAWQRGLPGSGTGAHSRRGPGAAGTQSSGARLPWRWRCGARAAGNHTCGVQGARRFAGTGQAAQPASTRCVPPGVWGAGARGRRRVGRPRATLCCGRAAPRPGVRGRQID